MLDTAMARRMKNKTDMDNESLNKNEGRNKLIAEITALYSDIDLCISELLSGRINKEDSKAEGNALFKMEGLMVATLQDLSCVLDYLKTGENE